MLSRLTKYLLLLSILIVYIYHVLRLVIIPVVPSGDDSIIHISYCVYLNITKYFTADIHGLLYPNFIHVVCGLLANNNLYYGITLYKIIEIISFLTVIILIVYLLHSSDYYIVLPLTVGTIAFGVRYIQTLGNGTIFYILSFAFFVIALYMAFKNKIILSGVFLGLSLIHYYGAVFLLSFLPYLILQLIKKKKEMFIFLLGFIIGFSPSLVKWIGLLYLVFTYSSSVSGYTEYFNFDIIYLVNYAYTPLDSYGIFIFSLYVVFSVFLFLHTREKIALVPLTYVIFTLITPILPIPPSIKYSVAYTELIYRLYRFLPLVTILFTLFSYSNKMKYSKVLHLFSVVLTIVSLVGLSSNASIIFNDALGFALNRIDSVAFSSLISLRDHICDNVITTETALYMQLVCPHVVFVYSPERLRHMSPHDPKAILAKKILEEYDTTGKISGYKWFVLQTPIPNQWYFDGVVELTNDFIKNITKLGRVKYIINNQGGYIYIVELS